ncbi:hypothetical protein [Reinekea thalattae]|uniref:Uncharacterized protein n=1 Tax=Reinekea thalattae TaxID=2593301 RepID=A0A5C8Z7U6_9GAMM|nr:hypothetical protein [Reinekea thalattae]TXR53717.1 hypothetical protein FME95_03925 [Reinekea thalattae]
MNKVLFFFLITIVFQILPATRLQATEFIVETKEITEQKFNEMVTNLKPYEQPELVRITDVDEAIKALNGRFIFNDERFEILSTQGDPIYTHVYQEEPDTFVAYYPEDNLIYKKDWMESDYVISTVTGEFLGEVPSGRNYSPGYQYRMSAFYNGQEAEWFIQKKVSGHWVKLNGHSDNYQLHTVRDFYWVDEHRFFFSQHYFEKYYLGTVTKK